MGLIKTKSPKIRLQNGINLYRQTYEKTESIKDVYILKLSVFFDDYGGWFKETLRLNEEGQVISLKELGKEFKPVQANLSHLAPGTKRFWHIHLEQNEIVTTNGTVLVGLIDYRDGSPTNGMKSKIVVSQDKALYIPSGVAHGFLNPNNTHVTLNYFADKFFVADENTQECRIDPKEVSFDFVEPELM